jgi:hypothetical protein
MPRPSWKQRGEEVAEDYSEDLSAYSGEPRPAYKRIFRISGTGRSTLWSRGNLTVSTAPPRNERARLLALRGELSTRRGSGPTAKPPVTSTSVPCGRDSSPGALLP